MDFCTLVLSLFLIVYTIPLESAVTYSKINEFTGPGGWLRLCKPPGGAEGNIIGATNADKCSSGFWFKDPIKVGCACGHGVWVFAKGWCDRTAKVIIAYNGTCFPVDKDVRYIRSIGYANSAFMPYHFQATVGFEYIQELPIGFDYTYSHSKYDQHLGGIFRTQEILSKNSKRCIEHESPMKRAFALKYYADRQPYKQSEDCFQVAGEQNPYTYDEGFDLDEYFDMKEKSKGSLNPTSSSGQTVKDTRCSTECPANGLAPKPATANSTNNNTMPADYVDPLEDDYYPVEHNHSSTANTSSKACDDKIKKYSLTNKTINEITEQTKRMIMANVAFSLKGYLTPEVKIEDFKFFQMSRKILEKVCPNEEVPHMLLTGLLRMFRVAVGESLRLYPFTDNQDAEQAKRIDKNLKLCLDSALPFSFEYKNSTAANPSKSTTNSTEDQCPDKFDKISYSYHGGSKPNRTLQSGIPCELETDTKLDLPIETAWKTVMFTHYYCARHFQANISDYSHFYKKMEMFFNRWIQHRWYYPGLGPKAYEFAFQAYDLKKFALNLDRCVGASRSFSNYRKWIKRPVYVKNCGGSLFQDSRQEEDKTFNSPGKKSKPAMLDAITPKLSEFGNTAYCLPYWHTPASNPGINYDPSKDMKEGDGCVNYKKKDWQDDMTPALSSDWTN